MTETARRIPLPELAPAAESQHCAASYSAFGAAEWEDEMVPMLELRFKSGAALALGYAWLARAEFDPVEGIELTHTDVAVTIRGRNLAPVYSAIISHKAVWLLEADRPTALLVDASAPVVESIVRTPANSPSRGVFRGRSGG